MRDDTLFVVPKREDSSGTWDAACASWTQVCASVVSGGLLRASLAAPFREGRAMRDDTLFVVPKREDSSGTWGAVCASWTHKRGRSGVSTVSENLTMACRRCQSGSVSSTALVESMAKTSSICLATSALKTSMLIS
jgi:hypothetical protein